MVRLKTIRTWGQPTPSIPTDTHQHASDELKNRVHGASTGLSLLSFRAVVAGLAPGQGGRRTGCACQLPTRSLRQSNPSVAPTSSLFRKKPAAACCLDHFSCGMMIRGGEARPEREWVGVAGGRLRVLVALCTICCHGLSFGCRLVWRCGRMNLAVTSETGHRSTMRPVTLMTFLFAAQSCLVVPSDQREKSIVCSSCNTLIGCILHCPSAPDFSNIISNTFGSSFKFCRSFSRTEMVKAWCMDGELRCCIVMCHRLEESRIAIKTFWPISDPILPDAEG